MRPRVCLGTALRPSVINALGERYELLVPAGPLQPTTVPAAWRNVRALLTLGTLQTNGPVMDALPELGLICCYGSGYEGVDLDAARDRGIAVSHSPGGNAASVADMAMALLLASMRRVVERDRFVRDGRWASHPAPELDLLPGLTGARLGIYGLGHVGAAIARRAAAFEMRLGYFGRAPHPSVPYRWFGSLLELARWADALVVATRATPGTIGSVDATILAALGSDGHLVNVARGSIIDESALVRALKGGELGSAGLDVFVDEPGGSVELRTLPNVVLSPHVAGATVSAQRASQEMVLANLDAFFADQPLPNPVPGHA